MIVDLQVVAFAFLAHHGFFVHHTDYGLIEIPWLCKIHEDPVTECYSRMGISLSVIVQNRQICATSAKRWPKHGSILLTIVVYVDDPVNVR